MAYYWAPMIGACIAGYPVQDAPRGTGAIHDRGRGPKLIHVPEMAAHPSWRKLAEHAEEPLSAPARRWCGQDGSLSFADAVGRWLRPQLTSTSEGRYEVWCGDPARPLWSRLTACPTVSRGRAMQVRDFWPDPRHRECLLDTLGFMPAVSVGALAVVLAAGLLPLDSMGVLIGALPITDAFTGVNGTDLSAYSANWTVMTGGAASDMQISTNAVIPNAAGRSGYRWTGDTFDGNHYAQGTLVLITGGADMGVAVRCQSGTNSLYSYYGNGAKSMNRMDSGTNTALGSGGATTVNDRLFLSADGSTIRGVLNGALDTGIAGNPFTDTTYTGGGAGLAGNTANANNQLDNWVAGNLPANVGLMTAAGRYRKTGR